MQIYMYIIYVYNIYVYNIYVYSPRQIGWKRKELIDRKKKQLWEKKFSLSEGDGKGKKKKKKDKKGK